MSIESLKTNIEREKNIIKELSWFLNQIETIRALEENKKIKIESQEKRLLGETVNSLVSQLKILNNSLPRIIRNISFFKKLPEIKKSEKKKKLISMSYRPPKEKGVSVTINKEDKEKFLKSLSLGDLAIKRLKKRYGGKKPVLKKFKKPSLYAKFSNRFFRKFSNSLVNKDYFISLNKNLRKISSSFMINTYISMIFFSMSIAFLIGIFVFILSLFFGFSFNLPFLIRTNEGVLIRMLKNIWILILFPVITFGLFYYYPISERKSIETKINHELPFVTIYMAAIATSGVEPTKIFQIIVSGKDYPATTREIRKLLNQINFYGYDLSTALKTSAKRSPSKKLAELFNGLATSISSGSDLKNFLKKHAESLLFDYKLEREKYTKTAETFMNIYISVVIAAPMILMILFVVMNMTGMSFYGLSTRLVSFLISFGVAILNIIFIIFLQLKQPGY